MLLRVIVSVFPAGNCVSPSWFMWSGVVPRRGRSKPLWNKLVLCFWSWSRLLLTTDFSFLSICVWWPHDSIPDGISANSVKGRWCPELMECVWTIVHFVTSACPDLMNNCTNRISYDSFLYDAIKKNTNKIFFRVALLEVAILLFKISGC